MQNHYYYTKGIIHTTKAEYSAWVKIPELDLDWGPILTLQSVGEIIL